LHAYVLSRCGHYFERPEPMVDLSRIVPITSGGGLMLPTGVVKFLI
jgi:hypothetical protein